MLVLGISDFPQKINKRAKQSTSRSRPILRPVSSYNFPSVMQWLIVHSSVLTVLSQLQCWPIGVGLFGASSQFYGDIGMVFSHFCHKLRVSNLAILFIKRVWFFTLVLNCTSMLFRKSYFFENYVLGN